jgi:lipoprotein LpqH
MRLKTVLALTLACLVGCSPSTHSNTSEPTTTVHFKGGAIAQSNDARIVVDGQQHKVDGPLACSSLADDNEVVIAIGREPNAVKVTVSKGNSPRVIRVILQNVIGYNLFAEPPQDGSATATKDGQRYIITGTAWGLDYRPGGSQSKETKPFEIEVACP